MSGGTFLTSVGDLGNETVERRGNTVYFPKTTVKSKTPRREGKNDANDKDKEADAFKMVYEAKCRDLEMSKTSASQAHSPPQTLAPPCASILAFSFAAASSSSFFFLAASASCFSFRA